MLFPRLQRTLWQGVAEALRRWAHALQQQADEVSQQTSVPEAEATTPGEPPPRRPGEPPAHWLALIQNGPPVGWLEHVQEHEAPAFEHHTSEEDTAKAPQTADVEAHRERAEHQSELPPTPLFPRRPLPLERTAGVNESSPPPVSDKPERPPRGVEQPAPRTSPEPAEREIERQTGPPLQASSEEPSEEVLQGEREEKSASDLGGRPGRSAHAASQPALEPHETSPPPERVRTSRLVSPWTSPHPLRLTPTGSESTTLEVSTLAPADGGRFAAEPDVRQPSRAQADQANADIQAPFDPSDAPSWPRPPALPAYDVQQTTPPPPTAKTVAATPDVRPPALPQPSAPPRSHHPAPIPLHELNAESPRPTARWAALPDDAWPAFDDEAREDDGAQQRARQRRERLDREQRGLLWSA